MDVSCIVSFRIYTSSLSSRFMVFIVASVLLGTMVVTYTLHNTRRCTLALFLCYSVQCFNFLCVFLNVIGLLQRPCDLNTKVAPVPAKQPWWIWINTSCEFIMNDCITTTKQSTTKPCAYFLGYTVPASTTKVFIYAQGLVTFCFAVVLSLLSSGLTNVCTHIFSVDLAGTG